MRTAREAASTTGKWVVAQRLRRTPVVRRKGAGDFVTDVDTRAEARLRQFLAQRHPGHGFLGEESGASGGDPPFVWIVDPIDGTSNFAHGLTPYGVSLACVFEGQPMAAAVYCAPEDVVYSAAHQLGAFRATRRLAPATRNIDDGAIVGVQWLRGRNRLAFLPRLLQRGVRVRNHGCTVSQLCDVASGRLDGNVQEQGKIWDIAAAGLIVVEAGGHFTDWQNRPIFPFSSMDGSADHPSVGAIGRAHRQIIASLRSRG